MRKSRRKTTKFFLTSDKMNNDRQLEKAALPQVDFDSVEAIRVEDLGVSSDSDEYDSERPSKRRRLGLNAILMSRLDESNQIGREISESLRILSQIKLKYSRRPRRDKSMNCQLASGLVYPVQYHHPHPHAHPAAPSAQNGSNLSESGFFLYANSRTCCVHSADAEKDV
ncbi:hypothetical protein ACLKA7_007050 [Drosophila subpalustris]